MIYKITNVRKYNAQYKRSLRHKSTIWWQPNINK